MVGSWDEGVSSQDRRSTGVYSTLTPVLSRETESIPVPVQVMCFCFTNTFLREVIKRIYYSYMSLISLEQLFPTGAEMPLIRHGIILGTFYSNI